MMARETPNDPNQVAVNKLHDGLKRFQEMSTRGLGIFDWEDDLRKIGDNARMVKETERKGIRPDRYPI